MDKVTVDGCDYEYENCLAAGIHASEEIISVYDALGHQMAEVVIDHNVEQIFVTWINYDASTTGEYPYFEYEGDDDDLVAWVVSTAPWV